MLTHALDPCVFVQRLLQPATAVNLVVWGRRVLDAKWRLPHRVIPDHLIYALESGRLTGRIGGARVVMEAGDLLWMQPGVEREFDSPAESPGPCVTYCRFHVGDERRPLRVTPDMLRLPSNPAACDLLGQLLPEHAATGRIESLRRRGLLAAVTAQILGQSDAPRSTAGLNPHQRQRTLAYIHARIAQRVTLSDLARHVGLSPSYFAAQFTHSFGMPPSAYIKLARIRASQSILLETGLSVSETADRLGYRDIYYFSRQFKQVTGQSPRQWRDRAAGARV